MTVWVVHFSNGKEVVAETAAKALELGTQYIKECPDCTEEEIARWVSELEASYAKDNIFFGCSPFVLAKFKYVVSEI